MGRGVVSELDVLTLVGMLGRGFCFDGVQGWCLQTTGTRRDKGEVMNGLLKSVWMFCNYLFWPRWK